MKVTYSPHVPDPAPAVVLRPGKTYLHQKSGAVYLCCATAKGLRLFSLEYGSRWSDSELETKNQPWEEVVAEVTVYIPNN